MSEKLQKVLARVGLGSRRTMEEMISAGRVSINGKIAQLGDRVEVGDEIRLDGRKVQFNDERENRRRVILYYKPESEICSRHDPEGRPTVFDSLPTISRDRWVMVGRLDINSSGLLLFTNDGELANRLMHPSNGIEREYSVRVMGEVTQQIRQNLLKGVELEDGFAKFESFVDAGGEGINRWYKVVVKEGRNREVRRLFESQGLRVSRLLRTRYGVIHLPRELRTGRWLELDQLAINELAKSVNLSAREGVKFDETAKRRIDKMLDNPMKARRVERQQHRPMIPQDAQQEKRYNSYSEYRQAHKHQRAEETELSAKRSRPDDVEHERSNCDEKRFDDRRSNRDERRFDDRRSNRDERRFNDRRTNRDEKRFDDRRSNRDERRFDDRRSNRDEKRFDDRRSNRDERRFDDRRSNRDERRFDDRRSNRDERRFDDRRSNRDERRFDDRRSNRDEKRFDDRRSNRDERRFDDRRANRDERRFNDKRSRPQRDDRSLSFQRKRSK